MPTPEKQGLQARSTLTRDEIREIADLKLLCNEHDSLRMRIPLEMLDQRSGQQANDFLYYEQGLLVGYLYVDSWGQKEKEITGMVRPEFRRRRIFRQLFEAAEREGRTHGVECLILVCEERSHTGHAFAHSIKAHHDFSEHEMVLGTFIARGQSDPLFQMRLATGEDDKQAIISILASDMGSEEDARQLVDEFYETPGQHAYLATLDGKPLGTLRLDYHNDAVGIYGFVVRPEYRGRGYGRLMLEYIIQKIKQDDESQTIMLEVETTNHHAIGLYGSCGFHITTTYEYFNRTI
jgi:ribosomal protein S18 acetylase RimI-like enzyme